MHTNRIFPLTALTRKETSHSCGNYSQVDPCSAGGVDCNGSCSVGPTSSLQEWGNCPPICWGYWWLMTLSFIILCSKTAVSAKVRPSPGGCLHPKTGNESKRALFSQGRTTPRVTSDPKLPKGLAEVFVMVQWQFNSSICRILLPLFPHRCWLWKHSSKNCLRANLCLWVFFLGNLETLSKV